MLPKLRERAEHESGFTLIELLVVLLMIGILAALSIPSFVNQTSKGNDAEAKTVAIAAAKTMETCATEHNGRYTTCTKAQLETIEPTLSDADVRLSVTPAGSDYEVVVTSNRDGNSPTFTLSRSSNGAVGRTCSTGGASPGGCSAELGGTW